MEDHIRRIKETYIIPYGYSKKGGHLKSAADAYGVRLVADDGKHKFHCLVAPCRDAVKLISLPKGATTTALDHLRHVHNIDIAPKMTKRSKLVQIIGSSQVGKLMSSRQAILIETQQILISKQSYNSADIAAKTVLIRAATGNRSVGFYPKVLKHAMTEYYYTLMMQLHHEIAKAMLHKSIAFVSFNIDELHSKYSNDKYLGIRLYFVTHDFTFRSALVRFSKTYPDGVKRGVSTVYITARLNALVNQLGFKFYASTTDQGSDVKAACSKGEFGDWMGCVNHIIGRSMIEAWGRGTLKDEINVSIKQANANRKFLDAKNENDPESIKVTSTFDKIRWNGTFQSLSQINANLKTFIQMPAFPFLNRTEVLEDLEALLKPLVDYEHKMQTRIRPIQVECIVGAIALWETVLNLKFQVNGKTATLDPSIRQLRSDMKVAFTKRFYARWLPNFKGKYVLERCLLMCPQYKRMDILENWMLMSKEYASTLEAALQFQKLRQIVLQDILTLGASVASQLYPKDQVSEQMKGNRHPTAETMMQFGYQGDERLNRASIILQQMKEHGLLPPNSEADLDTDIILNDIYVQRTWNELFIYLTTDWRNLHLNELEFWKSNEAHMPILAAVGRIVYSLPVSSAPLENDYSVATQLGTPSRSLLSGESFETSLFVARELCQRGSAMNVNEVIALSEIEAQNVKNNFICNWLPLDNALISS